MTAGGHERARGRGRGRPSRSTGRRLVGWLLRLAVLAVVFVAGLAIGKALEQSPSPGGTQTIVRTLEPLTVEPQERTVTVTTSER